MPKTISFHSFRRGTGKSNIIANIASLLANEGMRVGVIDTDLQSPSSHILYNLEAKNTKETWTDFLRNKAPIEKVFYDVTPIEKELGKGKIFLAPANIEIKSILSTLREGFEIERIGQGNINITKILNLDILLIDTYAGLKAEAITPIALSDMLFIVMRLDKQDYQGTSFVIQIGQQLGIKNISLILNDVPPAHNISEISSQIKNKYDCEVTSILPHSPKMLNFASQGIFVNQYPKTPLTNAYRKISKAIIQKTENDQI